MRVDILLDVRHFAFSNGDVEDPLVLVRLIRNIDFSRSDADDQNPISLRHEFGGLWVFHFHLFGGLLKHSRLLVGVWGALLGTGDFKTGMTIFVLTGALVAAKWATVCLRRNPKRVALLIAGECLLIAGVVSVSTWTLQRPEGGKGAIGSRGTDADY